MPSTYTSLLHHLVFSTKYREPLIDAEWRSRFHAYLAGTVKGLGAVPMEVGGVSDHVHLLVGMGATPAGVDRAVGSAAGGVPPPATFWDASGVAHRRAI